ncbi:MAG: methionine biosynthesis protein MetW [Planctomycetota bacterium]|nr:methionine biosynthesis protein MetW [Planctomycetota bacterium]MEC8511521.1 methionine biosynthesis protein MetW [Planctomycetota bacterium]
MTTPSPETEQHCAGLREAFCAWLIEQDPAEVLDVGAGRGDLIRSLRKRDVMARGVESSEALVGLALELGLPVDLGEATRLDEEDGGVPWVSMHNLLHRISVPERALKEALRVASVGVLIAEPFVWPAIPAHRLTSRLDSFTRGLERRRGIRHGEDLAPGELASMLPPEWEVEIRVHAPLHRYSDDDVRALIESAAESEGLTPGERDHADALVESARLGMLAAPGAVFIMARRPGA